MNQVATGKHVKIRNFLCLSQVS